MKKVFLQTLTFLLVAFTLQTAYTQVTITAETFPRETGFIDTVYRNLDIIIPAPTSGADQVWDYSALAVNDFYTQEHFDAELDVDFPSAQNYFQADLQFQGFPISSVTYEDLDAEGWFNVGRTLTDVIHPITAITGGPSDVLRFVGESNVFDGRINILDFPVTYEKQWSQSRDENINFELTVAAFGLNSTPGQNKRTLTENRAVVGYGTLIIPDASGEPTPAIDVLLMSVEQTRIDSMFLGGAPAPDALLAAFGLVQGGITSELFYVFYTPGFGSPVLNINPENNTAFFRPQAADVSTGLDDLNQYHVNYFPNPISKGQTLHIQTEFQTYAGDVYLYNLNGQLVQKTPYFSVSGHEFQLSIPANTNSGSLIYKLHDQNGQAIGNGKLLIE